jgi:hypothetical protein
MTALFANDVRHNNPGFILSRDLAIWKRLFIKGFLIVNQARLNICAAIRVKMMRRVLKDENLLPINTAANSDGRWRE